MIRKPILFGIVLMTITTAVFAEVVTPSIPTADIEGGKDHPLLKRYAGSYIVAHQYKGFDEFTFPLSKLKSQKDASTNYNTKYSFTSSKTVEGPYTRLVYLLPADRSPLEIIRNYQDEIIDRGGKVLYECKREECGGKKDKGITEKPESLASFLRPYNRLGMKDYSRGYCATTCNIMDQRYLVAELPDVGAYISIHTYAYKDMYYTNCDAFKGRTVAVVDIVEGKPREKNMVVVEASDMAQQISATGSVSIYGILFDTNKSSIRADSGTTLQEIAKLAQQQADMKLLVVGHTDNAGTFEYNMDLSQSRALAVVEMLSTQYGISRERLTPVGVSFSSPVSSNATEEGRALNRRVELVENRSE